MRRWAPLGALALAAALVAPAGADAAVKRVDRPEARLTVTSCVIKSSYAVNPKCAGRPTGPTQLQRSFRDYRGDPWWGLLVRVRVECKSASGDPSGFAPIVLRFMTSPRLPGGGEPVTFCDPLANPGDSPRIRRGGGTHDYQKAPLLSSRNWRLTGGWRLSMHPPNGSAASARRIAGGRFSASTRVVPGAETWWARLRAT